VQDKDIVQLQWQTNMKSYVAYRREPSPVTFSDVETFVFHIPREILCVLSTICLRMNRKAHVACNFNYLFKNEGVIKARASHVHCERGDASETVELKLLLKQTTNRQ